MGEATPSRLAGAVSRRAALGLLGAGALGYAVFGPRPRKERADGRLVLDYWEKWTQNEAAAMRAVVDRFNQSQDRLWVRYFSVAPIDQKAMIAIAGGDPPDILGLGNFSIPAYAGCGAILPLDEMVVRAGIRRADYIPAAWPMGEYPSERIAHVDGGASRLFGLIVTAGSLAMFYNRAMFREVGLDPDNPPRTVAELDAAHRKLCLFHDASGKLTPRDDGTRDVARVGFLHTEPNWWTWHFGYSFGGAVLDEAHNRATADEPANIRAYQWVQSYPVSFGAPKTQRLVKFQTGLGKYGTADNPFLAGKVGMMYQGPWLANVIQQYHPELDYAVAPFPVDESIYDPARPIGLLDGDVLTIPAGAKHPEASFEFIAFTQRPENIEALAAAHGKNSVLLKVSPGFDTNHVNRFVSVHAKIAASDRAFIFPRTRVWQEFVSEFDAGMQAMYRVDLTAADCLARIRIADQKHLDRSATAAKMRGEA